MATRALGSFAWLVRLVCLVLAAVALLRPAQGADIEETPGPIVRIEGPSPIPYERTALGRATHRIGIVAFNPSTRPLSLKMAPLRFVVEKDGVSSLCEDRYEERLPTELDPGESLVLSRMVSCETPLPGRYVVLVHAGGKLVGETAIEIDEGPNAPVELSRQPRLFAASNVLRDARPNEKLRVMFAIVNGSDAPLDVGDEHAIVEVTKRSGARASCAPESIDVRFEKKLAPGRSVTRAVDLACKVPEGMFDIDVALVRDSERVHLGTHPIRVGVIPIPFPGPTQGPTQLPATMTP